MMEDTGSGASVQDHIRELEKYATCGDRDSMAAPMALLRREWDSLSEDEQKDVVKLESIFLSLSHLKTGSA